MLADNISAIVLSKTTFEKTLVGQVYGNSDGPNTIISSGDISTSGGVPRINNPMKRNTNYIAIMGQITDSTFGGNYYWCYLYGGTASAYQWIDQETLDSFIKFVNGAN
jgi:hypothetical protein